MYVYTTQGNYINNDTKKKKTQITSILWYLEVFYGHC